MKIVVYLKKKKSKKQLFLIWIFRNFKFAKKYNLNSKFSNEKFMIFNTVNINSM